MKPTILTVLLVVCLLSCSKQPATPGTDPVTSGTWRISYYWDQKDETNNYSAYIFMFNSDGSLMAHTNTTMLVGNWSESGNRLTIQMGSSDPTLSKLNNSWLKLEKTSSSIKLKDDNPSQDDQLTFIKN